MRRLLRGILTLALLWATVPAYAANDLTLDQGDGTFQKLGGVGDRAKVVSSGGAVQTLTIASGVTTNTTSSAVAGVTGTKTIWGEVVCSSGACAQTQAIYGARENGAANGLLLCTLALSGTARAQDVCTGVTADYPYLYVITTNTSGTAAEGGTYVFQ